MDLKDLRTYIRNPASQFDIIALVEKDLLKESPKGVLTHVTILQYLVNELT